MKCMKTSIIKLDRHNPDFDKIKYAASILRNGGTVVFPTETVYGLGANGLDENAVAGIFHAKGRPQDNPLILHINDKNDIEKLSENIPFYAEHLIRKFWPGPLTLIVKKKACVPDIITAGLDTVALRMPSDNIALALIKESGVPVAAPSANISGRPSGTDVCYIKEDLYGKVDVILDVGESVIGLESTVLDITVNPPVILRPGGITSEEIERETGTVVNNYNVSDKAPRSPGMKYTHYSPEAELIVVQGNLPEVVCKINELIAEYTMKKVKTGVLATDQTKGKYSNSEIISMGDRNNPSTIANNLFRAFREMDAMNVRMVFIEAVDDSGIGLAIMNRILKASGNKVIRA